MQRRLADLERDYARLLAMQRESWEINFPELEFSESAFYSALRGGVRRAEVFVYERQGELVGWLWLDLSAPRLGGHICHVQVEQAGWGQGFGRQIVEDAIALCAERQCAVLTLNVTKSNNRALALYEHLGFTHDRDDDDRQHMILPLAAH